MLLLCSLICCFLSEETSATADYVISLSFHPADRLHLTPSFLQAMVSIVVTETERQMTWSRLEGLLLHWAVSRKAPPAEKWELPPRGWKTLPDTTVDAGVLCSSDLASPVRV